MLRVLQSPQFLALGSLVLLLGLVAWLVQRERQTSPAAAERPLVLLVAASLRQPTEAMAAEFTQRTGRRVLIRSGPSEELLVAASWPQPHEPADAFLPADAGYVQLAERAGLVRESFPLARMRAVVLVNRDAGLEELRWNDLASGQYRLSLAVSSAAIGKLARQRLTALGLWMAFEPAIRHHAENVVASANAVKLRSVDAAIVWDSMQAQYPQQRMLRLPELDGVVAEVSFALLKQSRHPDVIGEFAHFLLHDPAARQIGIRAGIFAPESP
jgi:molybdate transport system substrate-binding protein